MAKKKKEEEKKYYVKIELVGYLTNMLLDIKNTITRLNNDFIDLKNNLKRGLK